MNNETPLEASLRIAADYGVREDNPIGLAPYTHEDVDYHEVVTLDDPRLVKIDRLRLLGDSDGWAYPFLDLSYCWGTIADGRHVRVDLPEYRFPKRGLNRALFDMCVKAGVHGKKLGIYDAVSRLH